MNLQTKLALLRTILAEKRTAHAELQFSVLLVTLPLTLHTGILLMTHQHVLAERIHLLAPFWAVLGAMLLGGLGLAVHAVRCLLRVSRRLACLTADEELQGLSKALARHRDEAGGTAPTALESRAED